MNGFNRISRTALLICLLVGTMIDQAPVAAVTDQSVERMQALIDDAYGGPEPGATVSRHLPARGRRWHPQHRLRVREHCARVRGRRLPH